MTYALWGVQGLLALIFLFTGGTKLVLPPEVMTEQMPLPLSALVPLVVGLFSALVAYGHSSLAPHRAAVGASSADAGQCPLSTGY
jgi:hypothetical protein